MYKIGFDNDKYLKNQSEMIKKRIGEFGGKLYLEFGGKLFDDYHASRVLPGFQPDSKLRMLRQIGSEVEIIIVINANDIESNKKRSDIGISYGSDVFRLIDIFTDMELFVGSVAVTHFSGQPSAIKFKERLESMGVTVYLHYPIEGYPYDVPFIVSDNGFGKNDYIKTSRPLVVVTAPGPGSGKMAVCLSQLYHENLRGIKAGYAKFETFPVWNLPLKHPVNLAYEAATADLNDVNVIDPYHLEAYGKTAVNYNRDVEVFPVLNTIFESISGESPYKSPTDMGVNMAGCCIIDDEAVREASYDEIVRRYFTALCEFRTGRGNLDTVKKIERLMKFTQISVERRTVIKKALSRSAETDNQPAVAIELPNGEIVTGKTSPLLGASSAALLNAVKALGKINKSAHLIQPEVIEPIQLLKTDILGSVNPRLHSDETLIALSICAAENEEAKIAVEQLKNLRFCEAHSTVILSKIDEDTYRRLGINLTCEPQYQTNKLFHK